MTSTYRDVRVTGTAFWVCGGEDGIDEDEGADDLRGQARADAVARCDGVRAAAVDHVERVLETLHQACSADGPQALRHHVRQRSRQRDLARQQQPERHRRVNVPPCTPHATMVTLVHFAKAFTVWGSSQCTSTTHACFLATSQATATEKVVEISRC